MATTRQSSADETARRFGVPHAFGRADELIAHPEVDLVVVSVRAPEHAPLLRAGAGSLGGLVAQALALVRRAGVAIVRADPGDPTPPERASEVLLTALEAAGLRALVTPRGRIEDLRGPGDDELRSALPFLARPPSLVLLQCLRADGQELAVADARAAFQALGREDPRAAESLASVGVRFDGEQGARSVVAPMIDRDDLRIRGGPFTVAPERLADATALAAAHERFARLLHDPRHLARVRLGPGDWSLVDNHRALHAVRASWSRRAYLDAWTP